MYASAYEPLYLIFTGVTRKIESTTENGVRTGLGVATSRRRGIGFTK